MFEFDPELEYGIVGAVDDDGALIWDDILLRICWDNMPIIQYSSTIIWATVSDWVEDEIANCCIPNFHQLLLVITFCKTHKHVF
jgi:hypothetical protein